LVVGAALSAAAVYLWMPRGMPGGPGGEGGPPGGGFGFGPSTVEVVAAVETLAAEPVELLGEAAPVRVAVVASEVDGVVDEVLVDEGDLVRQGQVLARLRTTTLELDLAAARANRAEAAARLVRFESEVVRLTDLRERRAISEREFEQGIADRDAQAQLVTRFESEAARLEELIERAAIIAPFAGQVAEVHAEVGEWTSRGGDVATLMDLSRIEVEVSVPERYVAQAEAARADGVEVPVEFDALPGRHVGKVTAVLPQANPATRTFPAVVVVENPDGHIRGGMFARVLTQVGEAVPTVLIPKDGLVLRSGRTFAFRVVPGPSPEAPGGVEELEVEVGAGYGEWQAVRGGLAAGDVIVVRGNESLQPGMPVVVAGYREMEPPPEQSADMPAAVRREEKQ
jgi:RND family efflux transporter MFP subunit